jgi:beta-glucanase (GH16 family)
MIRFSKRAWGVAVVLSLLAASPTLSAMLNHEPRAHSVAGSMASGEKTPSPYRRLAWHDEFTGRAGSPPNPAKWQIRTGGNGWGNNELQYYTASPDNVSLDGAGHLAITAIRQNYSDGQDTRNYTSAQLVTDGRFQTRYGRIEARIKLPAGAGLWPAFWAVGTNSDQLTWPAGGEIDVMENIGSDPFKTYAVIHGPAAHDKYGYNLITPKRSPISLSSGFHVFGIDWSPGKIVFTLDGKPFSSRTAGTLPAGATWVFNKPFYLILELAVGGNFPGPPNASTQFPATMLVDWVRVYSG